MTCEMCKKSPAVDPSNLCKPCEKEYVLAMWGEGYWDEVTEQFVLRTWRELREYGRNH